MKVLIFFLSLFCTLISCTRSEVENDKVINKPFEIDSIQEFLFESSIRAIEVVNDSTVWFSGSGGIVGHTFDNGKNWIIDTLKYDTLAPNFRSLAITKQAVFAMSIETPALLYKYNLLKDNWNIVYKEEHPKVFYDALKFKDNFGIAVGDPTDRCLSIIVSHNYGENWVKLNCDILPKVENGEALFAASNTGVSIVDSTIFIASGGKKARFFKSSNLGSTWKVINTPFTQSGQMTGVYSIDFIDKNNGFMVGGDWSDVDNNLKNKAITNDGGETWKLVSDGSGPGYRTCVKYIPSGKGIELLSIGKGGMSYSPDSGSTWQELDVKGYYSLVFGEERSTLWLSGNKKVGRVVLK